MQANQITPDEIFDEALRRPHGSEREIYFDAVYGHDAAGRDRMERLLRAHADAQSFLEAPATDPLATEEHEPPIAERPGSVVGPYRLLQQIGEGGMGVVFLAQQTAPIHRTIALKIIKPGMDTRQVIARFEAERQALAMMDHPNIAKVFDAGSTKTGRPFFVMELVQGVPITEYCDGCNLTTGQRLELFVTVCHAVQHAHQKGVIHRDIKPTNLLVALHDGRPVPKIIDFGVAKAVNQRLTEHTLATAVAQMVGTPMYMSPEQAELSPLGVDTRTDIYSLGVLLYELLTGTTPFDKDRLHAATYDELRRIIREEDPPCPSTRISTLTSDLATTVADRQRTEPRRLSHALRGELDWIVMKCLDKDRNRRYETASELAADVMHFLNDEPVSAVAPSRLYRAGKFVRRNKGPVIASAAVVLGLVAGIIGSTVGLVSQSRQRAIAERERAEAQLNLAVALQLQRKYAEAEDLYRRELETSIGATAAERQRAAVTRLRLAEVVSDRSGASDSERLHREALAAYRAAFPPGDTNIAHALTNLALLLRPQLRFDESEPLFREAYEIHRRAIPADHRAIGESATNLANVLITLGRYVEAETIAREAIAEHQRAVPRDEFALAYARLELGRDLLALDKFPESEAQLVEAQRMLGPTEGFHVGALSLIALYTTWDQVDPGKGHDAKAQEWLRNLIGTFVRPKAATIEPKNGD